MTAPIPARIVHFGRHHTRSVKAIPSPDHDHSGEGYRRNPRRHAEVGPDPEPVKGADRAEPKRRFPGTRIVADMTDPSSLRLNSSALDSVSSGRGPSDLTA
jgi:hypothetical protein